jgi:hypothetical protein
MTIRPDISVGFALFGLTILTAFWGLVNAWSHLRVGLPKEPLPLWRRILATIGLAAVSAQAILFLLPWTRIGRDPMLFGKWAKWIDPTFLVAVPCVLAGKGQSRWWLLSSSILLFIISYLLTLAA